MISDLILFPTASCWRARGPNDAAHDEPAYDGAAHDETCVHRGCWSCTRSAGNPSHTIKNIKVSLSRYSYTLNVFYHGATRQISCDKPTQIST